MVCPKCGEETWRESADVGVGVIYGPYGCDCGWSEWSHYDYSEGESTAQKENPGFFVNSRGALFK